MRKFNIMERIDNRKSRKHIINIFLALIFLVTAYGYLRGKSAWHLMLILVSVPSYIFADFTRDFFSKFLIKCERNKKPFLIKLALSALLSIFIYVSFMRKPYGIGKLAVLANIGYVFTLIIIIFILSSWLEKFALKKNEVKLKKWELLTLMIFPLIVGAISLLGVFPGGMSPDSVVVWDYISKNTYNNAHPLLYLLFVKGLSFIWYSPAVVTIFQILLSSFTYAYIAFRLKEYGLNTILCYVAVVIMTIMPANLMINIVIWKDIPYTMLLLILSVEITRMFTNQAYLSKKSNLVVLTIISFSTIATRHNGKYVIIVFYLILILYFLIKKYYKQAIRIAIIFISTMILFNGIFTLSVHLLKDNFEKDDFFTSSAIYAIPIQGFVTVFNTKFDELNLEQKENLYKYLDIKGVEEHTEKYDNHFWMFQGSAKVTANAEKINGNKIEFLKAYFDLFKDYPKIIIGAYMRSTAIAWSSLQYGFTSTYVVDVVEFENENIIKIQQNVISRDVNQVLRSIGETAYDYTTNMIFWRPAFMLILILLIVLTSKNIWMSLIVILPPLLNHLSYFASCEGQCTRYMYANYSLFILILFFTLLRRHNVYAEKQVIKE